MALGTSISDHYPILLDINADLCIGRRFKFEAFWARVEGFMEVVQTARNSTEPHDNPYVVLDRKLQATAKSLKKWSDKWIRNIKLHIGIAMEFILRLDKAMDTRELTEQERALRRTLKHKLLGLCSLE